MSGRPIVISNQEPPHPPIMISDDGGATWFEMPARWRQDGRILMSTPDLVVQDVGRGREVWYAFADAEEPEG